MGDLSPLPDPGWLTTSTVLRRLHDFDDRETWERLVEEFRGPIRAFARRRGLGDEEAEEVVQQTLVAFAERYRRGDYDPGRGRLSAWLLGIAWRRALGVLRERGGSAEPLEPDSLPGPAVSAEWEEEWERALLERCLRVVRREFRPTTFEAFERTALQGQPAEEVAIALGLSRNAVFIARHRVGARLRDLVARCEERER